MSDEDNIYDGMVQCAWCEGWFLPDDMDGEHCRECTHEIFSDD